MTRARDAWADRVHQKALRRQHLERTSAYLKGAAPGVPPVLHQRYVALSLLGRGGFGQARALPPL